MGRKGSGRFRRSAACILLLSPLLICVTWIATGSSTSSSCPPCSDHLPQGKFMWYAPHSGFSNQVGELRNALRVAFILGRTLVVPPVTDHHALSLGSCPKYRVAEPPVLRAAAVSHFSDLLAQSMYYSVADIVNISAVSPRFVKTIDFRDFARLWCGAGVSSSRRLASDLVSGQCGTKLAQATAACSDCVRNVDDNCATTIWTYKKTSSSARRRLLMGSNPAKLKLKKYDGSVRVKRDMHQSLGSGSEAGRAKLLAFGSLFSADYQGAQTHVDFAAVSGDDDFDRMYQASEYLPLSQVIVEAGKDYVKKRIKGKAFFCAQLRLLDGQFKNHWSRTFGSLKSRLASLQTEETSTTPIFLMTDLAPAKWTGTYLEELSNDKNYELYVLEEKDELVAATARNVVSIQAEGRGLKVAGQMLPDYLLYLQEAICSCASLGFHGTAGSTIAEIIFQMRNAGSCTSR